MPPCARVCLLLEDLTASVNYIEQLGDVLRIISNIHRPGVLAQHGNVEYSAISLKGVMTHMLSLS